MPFAAAGLFGLLVGSFLNVVAYRLPRQESLSHPRSRCPGCETPIRPYDNVPVLSWLLLRGRCRHCSTRISHRYPAVEAVTALLAVAVVLAKGADRDAVLPLVLVVLLVPITLIDLEHRIIPNKLTAMGAVLAIGLQAALDPSKLPEHLVAGIAAGGFLLVAALIKPGGMGMGDVKLAAVLGFFLGGDVGVALLAGMIVGSLVGVAIMARKGAKEGRKTKVPFGPFLALGALVAVFAGEPIVHWYLQTFAGS